MNRHHSQMPQVLARIERRARQGQSRLSKGVIKGDIRTVLRQMQACGFQNHGSNTWISQTRVGMLEVMRRLRWRYPTAKRNMWGFSLASTGAAGLMFAEPLEVALFIVKAWPGEWRSFVVLAQPNDPCQPRNRELETAERALQLVPLPNSTSRKRARDTTAPE